MHVVITTVEVQRGTIDELAELFDRTNRGLVAGHDDWLGAYFTADRASSRITVIARWRNPDSYERLRSSEAFQSTMAEFATRFVGAPSIQINEVLVDM